MESITVSEWAEAEREMASRRGEPKPKDSVTIEEYMAVSNLSNSAARKRLSGMVNAGLVIKQRWLSGTHGPRMVYTLKPKKEWSKK